MSKHDPFNTHLVTCAKPESAVSLYLSGSLSRSRINKKSGRQVRSPIVILDCFRIFKSHFSKSFNGPLLKNTRSPKTRHYRLAYLRAHRDAAGRIDFRASRHRPVIEKKK